MASGRFGIIEAVKKACLFAAEQRGYLLRIGFVPLCLQIVTALLLQRFDPGATVMEAYAWSFPSNLVFAWFMFAEARLLLLGERLDRLPHDEAYLAARRHAMNLSVVILLLFDMGVTVAVAGGDWSQRWAMSSGGNGPYVFATLLTVALAGGMVWGLRFSVAHILAAVGYPIRVFLRRVRGVEFSLRLMAMSLVLALPILLALQIVLEALFGAEDLPPGQTAAVICLTIPVALLVSVLLNAAAAYALKEVLGRGGGRGVILLVTDREGREHTLEAEKGQSAMQVIRDANLPIKAECSGACACATCHVYVDPAWAGWLPAPCDEETDMLDGAFDVRDNSRLSCQIALDEALDGLKVTLAPGSEP